LDKIQSLTDRQIPADAIIAIKNSQPYNAEQESLLWLDKLVNIDKHRMPILTFAQLGPADMDVMKVINGTYTMLGVARASAVFRLPFHSKTSRRQ
jgi:hypothetical protein